MLGLVRTRPFITLLGLGLLLLLAVLLRLSVYKGTFSAADAGTFFELRGARVLTACTVGAALGAAGVLLQALLRNPLASPDLLGLSSGATLAVVFTTFLASVGALPVMGGLGETPWQAGPALLGATASLGLVYLLSQRKGLLDPVTLVLVGVIVSIMCSAGVMLLQHLMPGTTLSTSRLLVGAISDNTGWRVAGVIGAIVMVTVGVATGLGRALDVSALGDDEAASVGLEMGRLRIVMLLASGVLAACAVVLAGPVGFVGLICPHAVRLLAGPGHRTLVPGAALAGAAVVTLADAMVSFIDLGAGRMPLGIVTAIAGGPVLVVLLRRRVGWN